MKLERVDEKQRQHYQKFGYLQVSGLISNQLTEELTSSFQKLNNHRLKPVG